MKLQTTIKSLKKQIKSNNKELDELILNISNNYISDMVKYQEELLMNICQDHKLSYEDLHNKYIKSLKKNLKKKKNKNLIDNSDSESDTESNILTKSSDTNNLQNEKSNLNILEKIDINGKICYIEKRTGGSIYNNEVMKIGEVKNNGNYFLYE